MPGPSPFPNGLGFGMVTGRPTADRGPSPKRRRRRGTSSVPVELRPALAGDASSCVPSEKSGPCRAGRLYGNPGLPEASEGVSPPAPCDRLGDVWLLCSSALSAGSAMETRRFRRSRPRVRTPRMALLRRAILAGAGKSRTVPDSSSTSAAPMVGRACLDTTPRKVSPASSVPATDVPAMLAASPAPASTLTGASSTAVRTGAGDCTEGCAGSGGGGSGSAAGRDVDRPRLRRRPVLCAPPRPAWLPWELSGGLGVTGEAGSSSGVDGPASSPAELCEDWAAAGLKPPRRSRLFPALAVAGTWPTAGDERRGADTDLKPAERSGVRPGEADRGAWSMLSPAICRTVHLPLR